MKVIVVVDLKNHVTGYTVHMCTAVAKTKVGIAISRIHGDNQPLVSRGEKKKLRDAKLKQ